MPLKSVIDIDIDRDGRFRQFLDLFEKYQEALKRMPADWAKVGGATSAVAADFGSMTAALLAQQELIHRVEQEQSSLNRQASLAQRTFHGVAQEARSIYQTVADTTRHLLRWTGITGLFGGLLGGYGIERVTSQGTALGVQALGLGGVDPGQLLSLRAQWGQFLDPNAALQQIVHAQQSLTPSSYLFGIQGQDPTQALATLMGRARGLYQQYGGNRSAMLLDPYVQMLMRDYPAFSEQAFRSLGALPGGEFAQRQRAGLAGVPDVTPETLASARRFQTELDVVTYTLEYKFLAALDKSGVIDLFVKEAQKFVDWLNSGTAKADIQRFTSDIEAIIVGLDHLAGFMVAHPALFGAIAGGLTGGAIGGPVGAVVGTAVGAAAGSGPGLPPAPFVHIQPGTPHLQIPWPSVSIHRAPGFQEGGIVPINAHPGEMVLPQAISEGFQGFFTAAGAQQLRQLVSKVGDLVQLLLSQASGVGIGGVGNSIADLLGFPGGGPVGMPGRLASGVVDMAKRIAGLGVDTTTAASLALIAKGESGFRDVWNFMNPGGNPNSPYSASGPWQILKSNWQRYAPSVGVTTPQAIGSSFEDQVKVAAAMFHQQGSRPWAATAPSPAAVAQVSGLIAPTTSVRVSVDNRTGGSVSSDMAGLAVNN